MEDDIEVLRLAAFTGDPAGGNPAGVVLARALPDDELMQTIAAEVGYSETAFLEPTGDHRYRIRYFSPVAEVPFCGHATIAAGVALGQRRGTGRYVVTTNTGDVPVDVTIAPDGRITASLTSVEPRHRPVPVDVLESFLHAFGWSPTDLDADIPPAEAYAGGWHLVLALRSRATLAALDYDFDEMRDRMLERGLTTVHVVWREDERTFHARDPFPVGGVVEDPATGAAAAAMGGYLRDAGHIRPPADITIHQGVDLGRPSLLRVHIPNDGGIIVTGTAVADPV